MKRGWRVMVRLYLRRRFYRDKMRRGLLRMKRWIMLKRRKLWAIKRIFKQMRKNSQMRRTEKITMSSTMRKKESKSNTK